MIVHRDLNNQGRGANIPNAVIDTALTRHPDGFGIAWRDSLGLRYEKFGPSNKPSFRKLLKAVDRRRDIEYVAHFRYATHGPACEDLAHPYSYIDPVEGEVLVFHNGIIDITTTKEESDTQVFVRDVLANLPTGWWRNKGIRELVSMSAGWSRLVLVTTTETINLNQDSGETDGGIWYSSNHRPGFAYSSKPLYSYSGYTSDEAWEEDWEKLPSGAWTRKNKAIVPYLGTPAAENRKLRVFGETTQPMHNMELWQHDGHILQPLQNFDFSKDGDYECSVLCEACGTSGDVYMIGGKAYIDIPHRWTYKAEDDEEAKYNAILAEDDAMLLPAGQA